MLILNIISKYFSFKIFCWPKEVKKIPIMFLSFVTFNIFKNNYEDKTTYKTIRYFNIIFKKSSAISLKSDLI